MKIGYLSCLILLCGVSGAWARPVAPTDWSGSPIQWCARADRLDCLGGGFAPAKGFARGARMSLEATVVPRSIGTNNTNYATFGVAAVDSEERFWHLALAREPLDRGGKHFVELAERNNGIWPAQGAERLRVLPGGVQKKDPWQFGETYRLSIRFADGTVHGEVRDASGAVVWRRGYALKDGCVKGGQPALRATGTFRADVLTADAESADPLPALPAASATFPSYVRRTPAASDVRYRATGFFRIERGADGRDRAIDPEGREVVLLGCGTVRYDGHRGRAKVRYYKEWNDAHYPSRAAWEEETLARLADWGFNRVSGGDKSLFRRGFMHSVHLSMGSRLCSTDMPEEFWICPNPGKPCAAFPNVFHPRFRAWCDWVAQKFCAPNREDPWLFGYYTDNELAWWGRGARDVGLYNEVLKLPADHTARQALAKFAAERGVAPEKATPEMKLDFLRLAAEIYFRECAAAVRAADPNHLVLGARFAGLNGAHPAVWEIAGRHCDVVTFNIYPWADLERNVVRLSPAPDAETLADAFAARHAVVKKPFLITEWSFPALDSGLPCTHGAGQRFQTQALRAQATELFVRTVLNCPSVLGYDYFMWVDQPPEGISDVFPEDSNYGLVSEKGKPYPLVDVFARLQKDVASVRAVGLPQVRPAPPKPLAPTAGEIKAQLESSPLGCAPASGAREAAAPRAALLLPEPKPGKGPVLKDVKTADGRLLGDFTLMVSFLQDGGRTWASLGRVVSATRTGDNAWTVVGEGYGRKGYRYQLTFELTFFPGADHFLANVVELKNSGTRPLDVKALYFRTEAPFAAEDVAPRVPNLWQAPCAARWIAPDGRWFGVRSTAATATRFTFNFNKDRRSQHPDATFEPVEHQLLAPGASYRPEGTMWCVVEGGMR